MRRTESDIANHQVQQPFQKSQEPLDNTEDMSIGDLLRVLVKRKWLIIVCTAVSLVIATAYAMIQTPIYEAVAAIRIDPGRMGSLGLSDLISLTSGDGDQLSTEIEMVKSDGVILATLGALPPPFRQKLLGYGIHPADLITPERMTPADRDKVLGRFKGRLICKRLDNTQILQIKFRDADPVLASVVANQLVESYIRNNFESRYGSVVQVSAYLSDQMSSLKDRAASAQKKLSEYEENNNILGGGVGDNTITDRLKLLNSELTQAEADRIGKEALFRVASSGNPQLLESLAPDPFLQSLDSQRATLAGQNAQLSSKFGPGYQPLRDLRQQILQVDAQVTQEVKMVTGRLQQEYEASLSAESMIRAQYLSQMNEAYSLNRKVADFALLRDEGQSSRDLYDMLQYKLQQAGVDAGLGSVNTTIVSKAQVPSRPAEPKKSLLIAVGLCLGLATGVAAVFLRETINNHIQSADQVESVLGLPTLAVVPSFLPEDLRHPSGAGTIDGQESSLITLRHPLSHASEAYRNLRNSVLLSALDASIKTVLVTSSLPGEGKSTTAANYAVVLAQKKARVLLVDADLRRPSLHRLFHTKNLTGLSSRLIDADVSEVLSPVSSVPTLFFIPAGGKSSNPSEVLGSQSFRNLIAGWEKEYDYIIIDSAPVLRVSDSIPIASWVDAVLIVARYGVTPVKALRRTKTILSRTNARIHGVILNAANEANEEYYYYAKHEDGYYS
jgi:succinoglycan biosynthesis transport protein ExoP